MNKILFLIAALLVSAQAPAVGNDYSQYILYKSGATYLPASTASSWLEPSNAYTAITMPMPFDYLKAHGVTAAIASAQIVWKANSLYANTGAAMYACPAQPHAETGYVGCTTITYFAANDTSGPAGYTPGCATNPGGPMPCRADVTATINTLITNGVPLYLTIASYGNGSAGPMIWDVELLVNWTTP
jgi:hypothetical protein